MALRFTNPAALAVPQFAFPFVSLLIWFVPAGAQSVSDTTVRLPDVTVSAPSPRLEAVGTERVVWDHAELDREPSGDVGQLLSQSGTYIKHHGPGSLATSSIRGGNAGHTLVLWNGLPVQSPMLGLLDLSLLPTAAFSSVSLTRGGQGALWGSGAVGGTLRLESEPMVDSGWRLSGQSGLGSFRYQLVSVALNVGYKRWRSRTYVDRASAKNNFPYTPAVGLPLRRQTNATITRSLLTHDLEYDLAPGKRISLHGWWQETDRQIPPTTVQRRSVARQYDRSRRLMMTYTDWSQKYKVTAKVAVFNETLRFRDEAIRLDAPSGFTTGLGEVVVRHDGGTGSNQTLLGITGQFTRAHANGYVGNFIDEDRQAIFATHTQRLARARLRISGRQGVVNGQLIPFVPTLGFEYVLNRMYLVSGTAGRSYRLPTLNDRFWTPGGNPDLRPESGWSQEMTLRRKGGVASLPDRNNRWRTDIRLTVFNRVLNDYILWSLPDDRSHWSAGNVSRVWSRGLEPRIALSYAAGESTLRIDLGYDYIRSTNEVALLSPRLEAGAQLLYVPEHQAHLGLQYDWRRLSLSFQQRYTGPTSGINASVSGFTVADARLRYSMPLSDARITTYLDLHNLWGADYTIIERRPMPGRYFRFGLQFSITHNRPIK